MQFFHRNVFDIIRGSAAYLFSGLATSAAPFVISLLISRYLGKEALGLFSVCFAIVLAGVLISDLGLNSFIMREFAGTREPSMANLRTLLKIRLVTSLVVGVVLVAVTFLFIPSPDPVVLSTAAFVLIILRSVAGALENVVKARMYRSTYSLLTVSSSIAHVVLVYGVMNAGYDIAYVFAMMSAVEMIKALFLTWFLRGDFPTGGSSLRLTLQQLGSVLKQGLPFAFIGFFTLVIEKGALFLLAAIQGNGEAGIYSAADRFLIIGVLLDSSLFASALPVFSLLSSKTHLHRITLQSLTVVLVSSILGSIVLLAGAPILIGLTFRFSDSIDLLRILSLSLPGLLLNSILRIALISIHRERDVAIAYGVSCVVNIALNLAVIPQYGASGAAVVTVITEYVTSIMYGVLYLRSMTPHLEVET